MRCTDYIVWICGHIDGTNSTKEEQTLQDHLKSCPQCRKLLEEMQSNDALLKENALTPPDRILKNVMSTVRKDAKKKTARIRSYILSVAAMAAVLCLVLMASLRAPELPTESPVGRSMDTPTAAPMETYESAEEIADDTPPAMGHSLETAVANAPTEGEDRDVKGVPKESKGQSNNQFNCVFVELPSRDMVPEGLNFLAETDFFPWITREAQDLYLYGGSMIYGATLMEYEEMMEWESQIQFRFMQEFTETDTYIVVFCSESR